MAYKFRADEARCKVRLRHGKMAKVKEIKLSKGCEVCGFKEDSDALQFDHIDPTKKYKNISKMMGLSWERIQKEIDKCRVLCANHHAIHSKQQRIITNNYKNLENLL